MNETERERFRSRRGVDVDNRAGRSPVARGRRSLYRPDELLLDEQADRHLADLLTSRYGGQPFSPDEDDHWRNSSPLPAESGDVNARLAAVGITLWTLPPQPATADLPGLVRELRARLLSAGEPEDPQAPRVSLNHVYCGEPVYQGGPDGPPFPVDPLTLGPASAGASPAGLDLAILDTGLPADWQTLHEALADSLLPDLDNQNRLFQPGTTWLDTEAGHGLFICGLVYRVAPHLVMDPGRVLDPTGFGDDASLAVELAETRAPVICLSLGGYTEDDVPPPGLSQTIAAKGRDVVVVAAAGNNGSERPFWPAALKQVIAVGCFDSTSGYPARADFSNRGPWVDVCAPGVKLRSTYVNGTWHADNGGGREFHGWAGWSGTSFAAPLVAAEIARRLAGSEGRRTARQVAFELLAELPDSPWPELGALYQPPVDLTR